MNFLIVNPGSTSKRFAFYKDENLALSAYLEHVGGECVLHLEIGEKKGDIKISEKEFHKPHKHLLELLIVSKLIFDASEINAIAIRIVAPGTFFQEHKEIDEKYLNELEKTRDVAPLHITPVIEEVKDIRVVFEDTKLFGISDSAFHKTLPQISKNYAINKDDAAKYGLYRTGYHGLSINSILRKIEKDFKKIPDRIVVCHLGGGASITAIKNGKSIDTSMGFGPLEGLVMATRVGDIDPGILILLGEKLKLNYDQLEDYLNHKSGLLGLSGKSSDPRDLFRLEKEGDENAKLALDIYAYRIKKYIGAYIAALNGLDLLVFSGAIGERSWRMRERICKDMDGLGIELDSKNNKEFVKAEGELSSINSSIKINTYKTSEEEEVLIELTQIIKNKF